MNLKANLHLKTFGLWSIIALLLYPQHLAHAEDKLLIACAINFINPLTEIVEQFENQHHVQIDVSYGSSGKLYGQLKHSAPYSLFLSADHKRPQLLHEQGICALPFHYTSGQVVLWSKDMTIQAATWQEALQQAKGKIAMASPDAAPYGEKAFDVLTRTGVFNVIAPQLTYGQSVGQTFLFATSGGAELGFIALSQALSEIGQKGQYWSIPEAQVVEQWGCIPHHAPRAKVAQELQDFLLSPPAQQISQKYGYLSEK